MAAGELHLVPLDVQHLEFVRATRLAVSEHLFSPVAEITPEMQRAWFRSYLNTPDQRIWVAIQGECMIGYAQLTHIDDYNLSAEAGFVIAPAYQGQGFGRALVLAVLHEARRQWDIHRIEVRVFKWNERAIRLYEACGFHHEGLLRDAIWKDGHYHNVVLMAWLKLASLAREIEWQGDSR